MSTTNTKLNRAEVIATMRNFMSAISTGVSQQKYQEILEELKKVGFSRLSTGDVHDWPSAEKKYNEAYQNFCIILALNSERRYAKIIDNVQTFDYVCNGNDIENEEFFIWYCSPEEGVTLLEKLHQQQEGVENEVGQELVS